MRPVRLRVQARAVAQAATRALADLWRACTPESVASRTISLDPTPARNAIRTPQRQPRPARPYGLWDAVTHRHRFPLLLAVTLTAIALAPLPALATEPAWIERRVGDLGVRLPAGAGWEQTERSGNIWVATRVKRALHGTPEFLHLALVTRDLAPAPLTELADSAFADIYLLGAIDEMWTDGVATGLYTLDAVDISSETHGSRTLPMLYSLKNYIVPWHPGLEREAQALYLLIPADFSETRRFYKIFLTADCFFEGCIPSDLDLSEMTPLLETLRDYSAPTN